MHDSDTGPSSRIVEDVRDRPRVSPSYDSRSNDWPLWCFSVAAVDAGGSRTLQYLSIKKDDQLPSLQIIFSVSRCLL